MNKPQSFHSLRGIAILETSLRDNLQRFHAYKTSYALYKVVSAMQYAPGRDRWQSKEVI